MVHTTYIRTHLAICISLFYVSIYFSFISSTQVSLYNNHTLVACKAINLKSCKDHPICFSDACKLDIHTPNHKHLSFSTSIYIPLIYYTHVSISFYPLFYAYLSITTHILRKYLYLYPLLRKYLSIIIYLSRIIRKYLSITTHIPICLPISNYPYTHMSFYL